MSARVADITDKVLKALKQPDAFRPTVDGAARRQGKKARRLYRRGSFEAWSGSTGTAFLLIAC